MVNFIAEYVTQRVKAHGVSVLRNESLKSRSVYLTFDCGQAEFLRISDHHNTSHARYNLVIHDVTTHRVVVPTKYKDFNIIKYYYTITDIDSLITDIIKFVEARKKSIGEEQYYAFCNYATKHKVGKSSGFWRNCKIV